MEFLEKRKPVDVSAMRVDARPLLRLVYLWMGFGLLVTTLVAVYVSNSVSIMDMLVNSPGIFYIALFAELGLVIGLGAAITKLSPGVAAAMFIVYAGLNGFTLSIFFLIYALGSIVSAFTTTVVLFVVMSVIGYTTQVDLTKYRSYFMMALIGLVIALVVNMFIGSGPMDTVISLFGVILFTALTAYDTQKIMRMAANPSFDATGNLAMKFSILGALTLYLDFINLFIFLLSLFGRRR